MSRKYFTESINHELGGFLFFFLFFFLSSNRKFKFASNLRRFVSLKTESCQLKATEQTLTFWSWQTCLCKPCTYSCSRMELLSTVAPTHISSFIAKSFDGKWGFRYSSILSLLWLGIEMLFFFFKSLTPSSCSLQYLTLPPRWLSSPYLQCSRLKNVDANKRPPPDIAESWSHSLVLWTKSIRILNFNISFTCCP